jgi:GNAT superfamily N-acetyltransferase
MNAGAGGEGLEVPVRVAAQADLDGLTRTLALAFREDPLWSWAFPGARELARWWRFLIDSALRYPWVFVPGDYAAATVWIPPDGCELTHEEEARVEPFLQELVGDRAALIMALLERFDSSHPRERPHYYLSLLGTHPENRGVGLGMGLLAENLARIDAAAMPAFLESSNPDNVPRYERLGFERLGGFSTPDDRHEIATMWREARPT